MITDLSSRFLVNLPCTELRSFDRVLYHLQSASWFYNDHLRYEYNTKPLSTRNFCLMMFETSDLLRPYLPHFPQLYRSFQNYLSNIHVYGCIIWSTTCTHILLVRGPTGFWSFPKGKKDESECGIDCARREVFEETGVDVGPFLDSNTPSVTRRVYKRVLTMYVIQMDMFPITCTDPDQTEIIDVQWIRANRISDWNIYPTVLPFLGVDSRYIC
jgi:mRNA-decapping enzyme subunit 2